VSEGRRVPLRVRLAVGVVAAAVIAALPISQAMSPRANDGVSGTPAMSPRANDGASGTPTMSPAVDGGGDAGTQPIAVVAGSTYHALTPVRILDSVTGAGDAVPLASETPASFQLAGAFGVPPGATAIAGALSISRPSHAGYVALTAVSTSPTTVATSTASFVAGSSLSVGVTATLGQDGKLWALYMADAFSQTVDIGLDLVGYYAPDRSGSTYHGLPPTRILDSRGAIGGAGPLTSGVPESFQLTGSSGIPIGATAVTGTLTIADASHPGRVALTPKAAPGTSLATSTLSLTTGDSATTGVTATLGPDGKLWAEYQTGRADDTARFVFDLTGYFTPDTTGSTFHRLGPLRLIDTRSGIGHSSRLSSDDPRSFGIVGLYGIPAGATAVAGTLTLVNPTRRGSVALSPGWPFAPEIPGSSVDLPTPDAYATDVTSALGADGSLWAAYETGRPGDTVDTIFDLSGYFAPEPASPSSMPVYFDEFDASDSTARDSDGVVQIQYDPPIGLQYNPVAISQAALAYFDRWHSGKDTPAQADADRTSFFAQVRWLVANQEPDGRWFYHFKWGTQQLPWWSAMAEGQAMSVLLRAYSITGDGTYLASLQKARSTFDRSIADLGVSSSVTVRGRQLTVYQEYLPGYEDNVLNGWVFALAGLYECATYTGDPIALYDLVAADRGLPALRALLPYYDSGSWTYYSLDTLGGSNRGPKASAAYHALHILQLRFLYSITADPLMREYADRFESYVTNSP
jgi:hypothetical protein